MLILRCVLCVCAVRVCCAVCVCFRVCVWCVCEIFVTDIVLRSLYYCEVHLVVCVRACVCVCVCLLKCACV